jgi:hypothetical protein
MAIPTLAFVLLSAEERRAAGEIERQIERHVVALSSEYAHRAQNGQLNGRRIAEMHIDRGYIASPVVADVLADGGDVICKPWVPRNGKLFTKADFKINMRSRTITCPAGEIERIDLGADVEFDAQTCARCRLHTKCTTAASGSGRTVTIADDELLQHRLRKLISTATGRERLRERVVVEHRLAHLGRRQGRRSRYRGTRKNLFDVRRASAVLNLEVLDRCSVAALPFRRAA